MKRWLLVSAFVLALASCRGGSDQPVHGAVVSLDPAKGEITLDHEDIPGLMKAMTMTFEADPKLLAGVEVGARVDFRAHEEGGRYVVTAIEARR